MRFLLFFIVCLILAPAFGQDTTLTSTNTLVVIYEPKMYRSTIDGEIAQANKKSINQVRTTIREGFNATLRLEVNASNNNALCLLDIDTSETNGMLTHLYNSISYEYVPLPESGVEGPDQKPKDKSVKEKLDVLGSKIDKLFVKKEKKEETVSYGSEIRNGQVVTRIDNREKFMQTKVENPTIIKDLCTTHHSKQVIFINQLDLMKVASEYDEKIKVRVHYTIFNKAGHIQSSGIEVSYFEISEMDLGKITREKLYFTANHIAKKL